VNWSRYLPILDWSRSYTRTTLTQDLMAAVIVTLMLIPQSLAYALLAGLPPQVGLYASIAPLLAYAVFGSSRVLAVGPVAVVSLMTAAAIGRLTETGDIGYAAAALTLAFLSGIILLVMGVFRLGFIANFLSHPVISGFITASGVIIAMSQVKHVLGIASEGHTLLALGSSLIANLDQSHGLTALLGAITLGFLLWVRWGMKASLIAMGVRRSWADLLTRAGPVLAVVVSIAAVKLLDLQSAGVRVVGETPAGLPPLTVPDLNPALVIALLGSAVLISVVGFVESVSVAQTLAAKKRQRIDPDQELVGLGAANLASSFTGGYPVTGGFARSVVNFDAGAQTPAAGALTALGILLATVFLTPLLKDLPVAVLSATIIVAVLSLVDVGALRRAWAYSKSDFAAMAATIAVTLMAGVETGVASGVMLSLGLFLYRTSRPHTAVVGRVDGTEHFRNVDRHTVLTQPHVVTLRVDESLYFANARYLEDRVYALIADNPRLQHFILMCPAVNEIDISALESLEAINHSLAEAGITLHLSEVKGPVMDRLKRSHFLTELTGQVYFTQFEAIRALQPGRESDMRSV